MVLNNLAMCRPAAGFPAESYKHKNTYTVCLHVITLNGYGCLAGAARLTRLLYADAGPTMPLRSALTLAWTILAQHMSTCVKCVYTYAYVCFALFSPSCSMALTCIELDAFGTCYECIPAMRCDRVNLGGWNFRPISRQLIASSCANRFEYSTCAQSLKESNWRKKLKSLSLVNVLQYSILLPSSEYVHLKHAVFTDTKRA